MNDLLFESITKPFKYSYSSIQRNYFRRDSLAAMLEFRYIGFDFLFHPLFRVHTTSAQLSFQEKNINAHNDRRKQDQAFQN